MSKYIVMTKHTNPNYMFAEDGSKAEIEGFYKTLAGALRRADHVNNMHRSKKFYTKVYLCGINDEIEYDEDVRRWYEFRNCMF